MKKPIPQEFSALEKLIAFASDEYKAIDESVVEQTDDDCRNILLKVSMTDDKGEYNLPGLFEACQPWLALYDIEYETLYSSFSIEINDESLQLVTKCDGDLSSFKFLPVSCFRKTEYSIVCKSDDNSPLYFHKQMDSGENKTLTMTAGLKELIYRLSQENPILPVINKDSIRPGKNHNECMIDIYSLITSNMDLHLEHSRYLIFSTLKQKLISTYKTFE